MMMMEDIDQGEEGRGKGRLTRSTSFCLRWKSPPVRPLIAMSLSLTVGAAVTEVMATAKRIEVMICLANIVFVYNECGWLWL